ncbi:MAG: riboflavin synthase subunit alpha, riboflavin synthase [Candidatus Peregrinibacteria bacterium GW2011_GWF2_43_17]|nr:MAG: riboflavin synthase subunit alpha, riboflavin synthase [Candidatus Peregrinibacteria bacterium GW2011_GWF2_43_17]KKT19509.1 MAG: riboflavin synthase subunit alpha [Candidatus Peregrinibacteria bacterium GW2011_GWA2_43_8]HAU39694.1 riboflavin synthase [Candidatus Peregrinibacteria bacterium]
MFTGIIKSIGKVKKVSPKSLKIELGISAEPGDSISINGVCLTLNEKGEFDVMDETFKKSMFRSLEVGDKVNIEPALSLAGKIGGHFVTGHVDFAPEVVSFKDNILKISLPPEYSRFFAIKGSVAINGVSLTICDLDSGSFSVSLVDFTLKNTNLGSLKKGSLVNIEVDLIARYMERMLKERNFI